MSNSDEYAAHHQSLDEDDLSSGLTGAVEGMGWKSGSDSKESLVGTALQGRYRIESVIGSGGFGTVYLATDTKSGGKVAVKFLGRSAANDNSSQLRFKQETRVTRYLRNRFIVRVYEFGEEEGKPFFIMDYLSGGTLKELLNAGPISATKTIAILEQVLEAVRFAHLQGVIHRDLKPNNIMFVDAQHEEIRLLDFGVSKTTTWDIDKKVAETDGELFGTPLYFAPERISGKDADERTDIYSLGCIAYECLTGSPPHLASSTIEIFTLHQSEDPVPVRDTVGGKDCPKQLEFIVMKMLSRKAKARYQKVAEVQADLEKAIHGTLPISGKRSTENRGTTKVQSDNTKMLALDELEMELKSKSKNQPLFEFVKPAPRMMENDSKELKDLARSRHQYYGRAIAAGLQFNYVTISVIMICFAAAFGPTILLNRYEIVLGQTVIVINVIFLLVFALDFGAKQLTSKQVVTTFDCHQTRWITICAPSEDVFPICKILLQRIPKASAVETRDDERIHKVRTKRLLRDEVEVQVTELDGNSCSVRLESRPVSARLFDFGSNLRNIEAWVDGLKKSDFADRFEMVFEVNEPEPWNQRAVFVWICVALFLTGLSLLGFTVSYSWTEDVEGIVLDLDEVDGVKVSTARGPRQLSILSTRMNYFPLGVGDILHMHIRNNYLIHAEPKGHTDLSNSIVAVMNLADYLVGRSQRRVEFEQQKGKSVQFVKSKEKSSKSSRAIKAKVISVIDTKEAERLIAPVALPLATQLRREVVTLINAGYVPASNYPIQVEEYDVSGRARLILQMNVVPDLEISLTRHDGKWRIEEIRKFGLK